MTSMFMHGKRQVPASMAMLGKWGFYERRNKMSVMESQPKNIYEVAILTESGCSIAEGEYSIFITKITVGDIGADDFNLVEECIGDCIAELDLPNEGFTAFTLIETGEREDVFWHKYYELKANETT
jgi:hypothetical protein